MSWQRFDRKRMRGVEIEVFFKTVGVKEIIANPPRWQGGKLPRVKIKL